MHGFSLYIYILRTVKNIIYNKLAVARVDAHIYDIFTVLLFTRSFRLFLMELWYKLNMRKRWLSRSANKKAMAATLFLAQYFFFVIFFFLLYCVSGCVYTVYMNACLWSFCLGVCAHSCVQCVWCVRFMVDGQKFTYILCVCVYIMGALFLCRFVALCSTHTVLCV